MPELPDLLQLHLEELREQYPWVFCYSIRVPTTPATRYRFTNYTQTVSFGKDSLGNPIEYKPFPITHSDFEQNSAGDLPRVTLTVGTPDDTMLQILRAHRGLRNQQIVIRLVNIEALDDPNAQYKYVGEVKSTQFSEESVSIEVASFDLMLSKIPGRRFRRYHCRHQYGDERCGADLTNPALVLLKPTCGRTLPECEDVKDAEATLGIFNQHPNRIGAFLSIGKRSS